MVSLFVSLALAQAGASTPVVVELFSSEGCSSCPQAERALAALSVPGIEVIPLERHVDYWNSLGWADPFASEEASLAQERTDTLRGFGRYTPQLIVDGRVAFSSGGKLERAVITSAERGARPPLTLMVSTSGRRVTAHVDGVKAARVEVFLIESNLVSQVRRGENAGATLAHAPVVRQARVAGPCTEDGGVCPLPSSTTKRVATFELDPQWKVQNLSVVAVVRESEAGPVVTAAKKRLN